MKQSAQTNILPQSRTVEEAIAISDGKGAFRILDSQVQSLTKCLAETRAQTGIFMDAQARLKVFIGQLVRDLKHEKEENRALRDAVKKLNDHNETLQAQNDDIRREFANLRIVMPALPAIDEETMPPWEDYVIAKSEPS